MCRKNRAAHAWALTAEAPGCGQPAVPAAQRRVTGRRGDPRGPSPLPCGSECALWIRVNISPSKLISRVPCCLSREMPNIGCLESGGVGRALGLAASEPGHRVAHRHRREPVQGPNLRSSSLLAASSPQLRLVILPRLWDTPHIGA